MLTEEQRQKRHGKIGASFVPALMEGNEAKIVREWMRLVEHPDYVEEDLSDNWPVQFGSYIEDFALNWHARKTGQPLVHRGQWRNHPELDYLGCTLDAYRVVDRMVLDCKAPGAYRKLDDVRAQYTGQLVVQKACVKAERAGLVIVHGGGEPQEYEAEWSEDYEYQVWERIHWFWQRVETLQPPCALPSVKGPVPAIKTYDMTSSNAWACGADLWLKTKAPAGIFKAAEKDLKALVPEDAVKAFGHGICASRSKAGAISIKGQ